MRFFYLFLIITIGSFFSCAPNLSEDEAKKVISQHFKPEPISCDFNSKNPFYETAIRKLMTDGYITYGFSNEYKQRYEPTQKGAPYLDTITYDKTDKDWYFWGKVVNKVVKDIKEVLIDKNNNSAVVTVTFGFVPVEPFYSLLCIEEKCWYFAEKINQIEEKKIKLKKYDKGWRVES